MDHTNEPPAQKNRLRYVRPLPGHAEECQLYLQLKKYDKKTKPLLWAGMLRAAQPEDR